MDETTTPKAIAILHRDDDDGRKSRYLSYRACYFSVKDSMAIAHITQATLDGWREDTDFYDADVTNITEFQKNNGRYALGIEFVRNFRHVLELDAVVLVKSLNPDIELTHYEQLYLNKLRSSYTPEQLDRLTKLDMGGSHEVFDIDSFLVTLSQQRSVQIRVPKEAIHE